MTVAPTRTLNPLPFGDLEPHRFEDLIRQLAYDLRRWKSLEATGRGGADEGIDIRGVEIVPIIDEPPEIEVEEGEAASFDERLWIFQCKREKSIGPKKLREVIGESLASLASPPHGFVLAVACDVSKAARDAFRDEMVARGVAEFAVWAKSELEDMLFQSRNDRLLFAYFGIALQPRRRNLSTALRAAITKKKQLTALLKDSEEGGDGKLVLIRDPTDERYPTEPKEGEARARWVLCRAMSVKMPGHLVVLWREHLAAVTPDQRKWDAIYEHDQVRMMAEGELSSANAWSVDDNDRSSRDTPHDFWNEYIPESDRAYLKVRRAVALERILALDPIGDGYFPVPHILAEFDKDNGPFTPGHFPVLVPARHMGGAIDLEASPDNRAQIFPTPLPRSNDPLLPAFDDTRPEQAAMTPSSEEKLNAFLHEIAATGSEAADETRAASGAAQAVPDPSLAFRQWRDGIAMPIFSAFVERIRAQGHDARVVLRSVDAAPGGDGFDSITLRVGLRRPVGHNRDWKVRGHVVASWSRYSGQAFAVSPSAEEDRPKYGAQRRDAATRTHPSNELRSAEALEAEVLGMLERLNKRSY